MNPVWLSRPAGVPAQVDVRRYARLVALSAQSSRKFRDPPAFSSMGATLSYAESDRLSSNFAAYLQGLGLEPGARIATMLPNLLQYLLATFASYPTAVLSINRQQIRDNDSCRQFADMASPA